MADPVPTWVDGSGGGTPLNASNLNQLSTAIRDLQTNVVGIYNARSYGAVANGTTDDNVALQATLDAAGVTKGIAYLPGGTYATSKCLNVPTGVTLIGDGMGVTTIKAIAGLLTGSNGGINGGYTVLGQKSGATGDITVRDLTVNGNHAATSIVSASPNRQVAGLVDFRGLSRVSFINIEVKDGWFYHLAVWTSTDVLIQGCKVIGPGTSSVYDQLDGIHLACNTRQTVIGCQIDMSTGTDGDDAIALHQFPASGVDVTDAVIIGNRVRGGNNGSGIDLANADGSIKGVTISGNLVHDCVGPGIVTNWFGFYTGITSDVSITGNTIRDCGASIKLGDISGNNAPYTRFRVAGNQCSNSGTQPYQHSTTNASNIAIERASMPPFTLTDATTIATDAANGCLFRVTLGGNRTLGNPTNPVDGQTATWELIQDGTGSRTLTLGAAFTLGTTITSTTLTTTASKRDFLTAVYNASAAKWYVTNFVKGY